jgi:hypothetical protein
VRGWGAVEATEPNERGSWGWAFASSRYAQIRALSTLCFPHFVGAALDSYSKVRKSEVVIADTPLTPMQKALRDIEGLRQSIRQMFGDLLTLELNPEDRAAISRSIQSLQDDLRLEQEKFERGG